MATFLICEISLMWPTDIWFTLRFTCDHHLFGHLCVFTSRFWLHSLSIEEKASNVDWGTRLITFICGSTVWGKQERPLPEEREAQALNVAGDVRKTKSDPVQLVLVMWLWDDEYKVFSIFFLKNMAATGTQGFIKTFKSGLVEHEQIFRASFFEYPTWVLVNKTTFIYLFECAIRSWRRTGIQGLFYNMLPF